MDIIKLIKERIEQCNAHRDAIKEALPDALSDAMDAVYMGEVVKVADLLIAMEAGASVGFSLSKNTLTYTTPEVRFTLTLDSYKMDVVADGVTFDSNALLSDIISEPDVNKAFRAYMTVTKNQTVDMLDYFEAKRALASAISSRAKEVIDNFQAVLSETEPTPV